MKAKILDFQSGKMKEVIDTGTRFWKIKVEFIMENLGDAKGVARYNPFFDRIEFFSKHIGTMRQKFPEIVDTEIEFAVLHELGHAKETRIYEEYGLWPYSLPIATNQELGKQEVDQINEITGSLFNGINDFKVEKELFRSGYPKPKSIRLRQICPYMEQILKNPDSKTEDKLTALMNMPQTMSSYRFCNQISLEKRRIVKSYYLKFLGKKRWKEIVNTLDTLQFGGIRDTIDVFSMFLGFFNLHLILQEIKKEPLEQRLKSDPEWNLPEEFSLPEFWAKNAYKHFLITS